MSLKKCLNIIKNLCAKVKNFLKKTVKIIKVKLFKKIDYISFKLWLKEFFLFTCKYVIYLKLLTLIILFLLILLNYLSNYYFITSEQIKTIYLLLKDSLKFEVVVENNLMPNVENNDKKAELLTSSSKIVSDVSDFAWTIPSWDLIHRSRIASPNWELAKELAFRLGTEQKLRSEKLDAVYAELTRVYIHVWGYHINRIINNEPRYPHRCPMFGLPPLYIFRVLMNKHIIIACDTIHFKATGEILTEEIFDAMSAQDQASYLLAAVNMFGVMDLV